MYDIILMSPYHQHNSVTIFVKLNHFIFQSNYEIVCEQTLQLATI